MTYDYRKSAAAHWDLSVLSIHPRDLAEMDQEEREQAMADALNRASDLLDAIATAFQKELGSDVDDIKRASNTVWDIARKFM